MLLVAPARPPGRGPHRVAPHRRNASEEVRTTMTAPARITLANGLDISRLVCGLWQVADMEKDGTHARPRRGGRRISRPMRAARLRQLRHGRPLRQRRDHHRPAAAAPRRAAPTPVAFTKWCPEPGPMTRDIVRRGVQERLDRLGVATRRPAAVPLVELRASRLARRAARDEGAAARRA